MIIKIITRPGLPKLRFAGRMRPAQDFFAAREFFRDELNEKFCKETNQFSPIPFDHHLKFRQKTHQKTVKTFLLGV